MNTPFVNAVLSRASTDGTFRAGLAQAFQSGGIDAATRFARSNGIALPASSDPDGELSDYELERIAGGKVWVVPWW